MPSHAFACLFLASCVEIQHQNKNSDIFPFITKADNQNYCGGSPVIEIIYPDKFRNEKHRFTLLQVVKEGRTVVETDLSWQESINGSYVCLDESLLEYSIVFIGYGTQVCKSYLYGFSLDNMLINYEDGKRNMRFINWNKSGCKSEKG